MRSVKQEQQRHVAEEAGGRLDGPQGGLGGKDWPALDLRQAGGAGGMPLGPPMTGNGPAPPAFQPVGGGGGGSDSPERLNGNGSRRKRAIRGSAADKAGKGLRHFSMKVCEKVESKGRTTYNEVADELVEEFSNPEAMGLPHDQQYDEKNIRRRVYDALNVLMAMDIIAKEKKEIQWRGFPYASGAAGTEHLEGERVRMCARMGKKEAHLKELHEQITGVEQLMKRNVALAALKEANHVGGRGVALPFILVQTRPQATVEVQISDDMQIVHFDFNSTPFELHDDSYVLRKMGLCDLPEEAAGDAAPAGGSGGEAETDTKEDAVPPSLWPPGSNGSGGGAEGGGNDVLLEEEGDGGQG